MTSIKMNIVLLVFVIASIIFPTSMGDECFKDNIVTVYVQNNLPSNSEPLKLRCQSKNTDFGYHTLWVTQNFHWKFCQNIFGRTLYFCHFYWGSKQRSCDVFRNKWAEAPDYEVYWSVRSDGIYHCDHNETKFYNKWYDWN
ncbi:hypothetical protein CASFOL_035349 [Castilleja foliolosa]|uniref:S-protein homolog n=1 Tax=Castilleja foliolosa TaxID=1961234 RepID=A0ABD3BT44_9LAMI